MAVTVAEKLAVATHHLDRALDGLHEGVVSPQTVREVVYAVGYLHDAIRALPAELLEATDRKYQWCPVLTREE